LEDGTFYLGDVIVNKEQAERQASEFGNNVEQEISELAGHGILHLLGVHHDGDDH
jgi:probable rRNA maturation factor